MSIPYFEKDSSHPSLPMNKVTPSDDGRVDLASLVGRLKFYSKFNGEIPRGVCAEAAEEIERLQRRLLKSWLIKNHDQ